MKASLIKCTWLMEFIKCYLFVSELNKIKKKKKSETINWLIDDFSAYLWDIVDWLCSFNPFPSVLQASAMPDDVLMF